MSAATCIDRREERGGWGGGGVKLAAKRFRDEWGGGGVRGGGLPQAKQFPGFHGVRFL